MDLFFIDWVDLSVSDRLFFHFFTLGMDPTGFFFCINQVVHERIDVFLANIEACDSVIR